MGSITLAIIEEEPAVMQISIIIKHYTEHYNTKRGGGVMLGCAMLGIMTI